MTDAIDLEVESPSGKATKSVPWSSLQSFSIGRHTECDLCLNDSSVSRKHCRLFSREDRLYVEDSGSRRGTRLDGELISVESVDDGSVIDIGDVRITVRFPGRPHGRAGDDADDKDEGIQLDDDGTVVPWGTPDDERTVVGGFATRVMSRVVIPLDRDEITIGRDRSASDFHLNDLNVSRRHCRVYQRKGGWWIEDLGSTNGTFVGGRELREPVILRGDDTIDIGSYHFVFDGQALVSDAGSGGVTLTARRVGVRHPRPPQGSKPWLLHDVNLTIQSAEFVGVLGASGGGKSTLLRAISGRSGIGDGEVIYDGESLYRQFGAFRATIGYAPQENIFHLELTLEDALRFASRLRLSQDASREEIEGNIDRVLKLVELTERRKTVIRNLSGGQKRRVSIAMELLGNPRVLFLDEVTSGLDPYLEEQMMTLFRRLSSEQGITVLVITHYPNSTETCDKVLYLKAGRLIFFGEPADARTFFGVKELKDIARQQESRSAEEWVASFERTKMHQRYVGNEDYHQELSQNGLSDVAANVRDRGLLARQTRILTERYIKVFFADRLNLLVLPLGPVVAWLLCLLTGSDVVSDLPTYVGKQFKLCVGATLIIFFLGIFGAMREIVKELEVYRHEHFSTVEILPYLLSKVVPLSFVGLVQSAAITWILVKFGGISLAGSSLTLLGVLFLTNLAAMLLGLAISAAVTNESIAIMIMLFFVIPQVLFGGGLSGPHGPKDKAEFIASTFITDYWSLEAAKALIAPYQGAALSPAMTTKGLKKGTAMMGLHAALFAAATVFFMVKRDGPLSVDSVRRGLSLA